MEKCWFYLPESTSIETRRVFGVIFILYCPVIITINVLLIVSIFATKQSLRNTSNFLIVCLSTSDSIVGAIVMPIRAMENFWLEPEEFCNFIRIARPFQTYLTSNPLLMTMLLAIDRYLHMNPDFHRSPSRLAKLFKRPTICFLILAFSLLSALVSLAGSLTKKFTLVRATLSNVLYVCFFLTMTILFVALYARGYLRLRRRVAANPIYAHREESASSENPEYLNELFKTVLLL